MDSATTHEISILVSDLMCHENNNEDQHHHPYYDHSAYCRKVDACSSDDDDENEQQQQSPPRIRSNHNNNDSNTGRLKSSIPSSSIIKTPSNKTKIHSNSKKKGIIRFPTSTPTPTSLSLSSPARNESMDHSSITSFPYHDDDSHDDDDPSAIALLLMDDEIILSHQEMKDLIQQCKCNLSAEQAMRRKKERHLVKLAKQLSACTRDIRTKEKQLVQMGTTINEIEHLLCQHQKERLHDQEKIRIVYRTTEAKMEVYENQISSLEHQLFKSYTDIERLRTEIQNSSEKLSTTPTTAKTTTSDHQRIVDQNNHASICTNTAQIHHQQQQQQDRRTVLVAMAVAAAGIAAVIAVVTKL